MQPFIPLSDTDYFAELVPALDRTKAGDRIALTSMNYNTEEATVRAVIEAATRAASRGAQVYVLIDAHDFMLDDVENGPLLFTGTVHKNTKPFMRRKHATLEALKQAGGSYAIINQPSGRFAIRVAGRSHIKIAVINDRVYLGGCNLAFTFQTDTMIRFESPTAADWLYQFVRQTYATGNVRTTLKDIDQTLPIDDQTALYVDAGVPRQSVILAQALQLIDQAQEHIFMTCQFFPNSITTAHLARAVRRGVDVEVVYNDAGQQTPPLNIIQNIVLGVERIRHPKQLFEHQLPPNNQRLHAKIIATEKAAIIGSHNYVRLGVLLGTAEIAIVRHDAAFSQAIIDNIRPHLIAPPSNSRIN